MATLNNLEKVKEDMTKKVVEALDEMKGMMPSEKEEYKQNILSSLNQKLLVTTLRLQSELTDAYAYNRTAFELYLDILTTFEYINNLYGTINRHQLLNESIVNTLYSNIASLNDKLDEYEAVLGTAGSPQCYIETFRTSNNAETEKRYYTERYGEQMPSVTYARFNAEQENITLNYTRQQNVIVYKSGVQLGEIKITKQYGAGFIKARNSEAKLENAIDTSMSSYWADTILADAEMKVVGEGFENTLGVTKGKRNFYNLPRGALCELCITFESMTKINEIVLNPFGNFPLDIIAIRYALSDDEEDEVYDIVDPEGSVYPWLTSTPIRIEKAFHFPQISCKRLYILINQIHCIKDTYMANCNQMFKNELWFNATYPDTADAKMENTTVFAPRYLDRQADNPVWKYVNDKLITNKTLDINDLLINNENKYVPITKYQYTYGFYNIAPNFVEFQNASIWVSQVIQTNGPVDTVTITSDEEHYYTIEGYKATDIEFYVTTKNNPMYNQWIPICPKNKDYVYHERLQLDYDYCYLRHEAICRQETTYNEAGNEVIYNNRPVVWMNDIKLIEDADYILRINDNGMCYAVEVSNIDHYAIYTVDYEPVDYSKRVTLIDKENPMPENTYQEIMGDGTGAYILNEYPYYARSNPEKCNTHVKLINIKTGEVTNETTQDSSPIQCVTNKANPMDSYKNFVASSNKLQYYTNGRYIYFNRPISRLEKIEVNYPSLDSQIRLKIILRRNTKHNLWITPVLNSYKLEFTTL